MDVQTDGQGATLNEASREGSIKIWNIRPEKEALVGSDSAQYFSDCS